MKATNLCLLVSSAFAVTLATAGCLQDYDEFQFGAGGAGSTATGATAAPGPTSGPGQTTTTTNGPTTTSGPTTTTNTTNTTNTVASTTMASTTSGGPLVDCGGDTCDVSAGETCCWDSGGQNGICTQGACGNDITIECDEAADCDGGEICCLHETNGNTDSVLCETMCNGFDNDPLCGGDGDAACANPTNCTDVDDLPGGFQSCQ